MGMYAVRIPDGRVLVERDTLRDAQTAAIYESVTYGHVEIIDSTETVVAVYSPPK